MTNPAPDNDPYPETWRSVDSAYELVVPSYAWMQERLNAVDSRMQALLTLAGSVTVAAPIIGTAVVKNIVFSSPLFLTAVTLFVVIVLAGVLVRAWGEFVIVDLGDVYAEGWLHDPTWEFKRNMVFYAGEHMKRNGRVVNIKGIAANIMAVLFVAAVLLFIAWIATANGSESVNSSVSALAHLP